MGEGTFEAAQLCAKLGLRPDPDHPAVHGFVEPDQPMLLCEHRAAIEATRPEWIREEW